MAYNNPGLGRRTAWHDAIEAKDLNKLEWLINKWPDDIEITGGLSGETPLMYACYRPPPTGFPEGVRLLIENDAELDTERGTGKTALMFAAQFNHADIAEQLLQAGADPTITHAVSGKSASGWAAGAGFKELGVQLQERTDDYRAGLLKGPGESGAGGSVAPGSA